MALFSQGIGWYERCKLLIMEVMILRSAALALILAAFQVWYVFFQVNQIFHVYMTIRIHNALIPKRNRSATQKSHNNKNKETIHEKNSAFGVITSTYNGSDTPCIHYPPFIYLIVCLQHLVTKTVHYLTIYCANVKYVYATGHKIDWILEKIV